MGNMCNKDDRVSGELPDLGSSKGKVSEDPTLVLPDFSDLKTIINRKTGEMDIDITRSERGVNSDGLSLILPACKKYSPTLIIKYYLTYSFYISKYTDKNGDKRKYQQLFYDLISQMGKEQSETATISKLQSDIQKESNDAKQSLLILNYAFSSHFVLDYLNKVLLFSNDPKDLAYFIFPIYSLHNGIKLSYLKSTYNRRKDPIWIVAVLDSRQVSILKTLDENKENYFFFSAFIRGFTQQSCAREEFKAVKKQNKSKTYFFTVNFPYNYNELSSAENNGFYIYQNPDQEIKKKGDVLFNIMSSFRVNGKTDNFQYDLDYGELAAREYKKVNDRDYGKEPILLKIYEMCRGISKYYLKSQSCLFRIMKGSNQSLGASNLVLSGTKTGNTNAANDIQRENIINTHIDMGEYEEALKRANEGNSLIFKAKKIQILYKKGKNDEVKQELANISDSDKKGNIEARLIIDQIAARLEMSNGEYKKAHERLKNLYDAMKKAYPNDFEYMGREVVSALVECERKGGVEASVQKYEREGVNWYTEIGENTLQLSSVSVMK